MDCDEDRWVYTKAETEALAAEAELPLVAKEPSPDKPPTTHLENKVRELHSNVRHITLLGMTWFGVFMGINYVTIGWFANASSKGGEYNPLITLGVAFLFIAQNILGAFGIWKVKKAAEAGNAQVLIYEGWLLGAYERWLGGPDGDRGQHVRALRLKSIPANLYTCIAWSLIAVLFLLCVAWAIIFGHQIVKFCRG